MSEIEQTKQAIQNQIDELESSTEEQVPMSQVKELLKSVKNLFEGNFDGEDVGDVELYGELGDLARYINQARKELRDFAPHDLADKDIPDASDQLDAIVTQTEQATGKIMDSCEQLEALNERIRERLISHEPPIDPDILASIDDAVLEGQTHITNIFESCNFQDLTGQRIIKIVKTLREIERQVLRMVVIFGLSKKGGCMDEGTRKTLEEEVELLEGPQLPGNSLEQDDIDDILSKLL